MPENLGRLAARLLVVAVAIGLASLAAWLASPFFEQEREYQDAVGPAVSRQSRVVVVGDSHAAASLPPELLADEVHNLAWGADGPLEMWVKLRYVLPRATGLRAVLVSVDEEMFSERRANSPNRSFLRPFLWELRDPSAAGYSWGTLAVDALPLLNDDFVQFTRQQLKRVLRPTSAALSLQHRLQSDPAYWGGELGDDARLELEVARGRHDHAGLLRAAGLAEHYRRIREVCRAAGVRTIAVRFPVSEGYRAQVPDADRARVDALVRELEFDQVLDYSGLFHDPGLFRDPDHLTAAGARRFLRRLDRDTGLGLERR